MRGLLIAGAVVLVVIAGAVFMALENRELSKRALTMHEVDTARGEGFELPVPKGYLLIDDERVRVPVGGVALGRRGDGARATIVIAPYPEDTDQLYSETGCATVARLHAKQIGAQLDGSRFEAAPVARCLARLQEGPGITGSMELHRIGSRSIMVTCRYPTGSGADQQACDAAAERLVAR